MTPEEAFLGHSPPSEDWPMPRRDPRNTAYTSTEVPPPLRLAWGARAYVTPDPLLLASDGVICVGKRAYSDGEKPETTLFTELGRPAWTLDDALPVYLKREVLVVAQLGHGAAHIESFNWKTRMALWQSPLGGRLERFWGAVERDGRLYCSYTARPPAGGASPWAPSRAVLRIVRMADGAVLAERSEAAGWGQGPPAVDGERVYWGVSHWLRALDAPSLAPQWAYYDGGNAYPMVSGPFLVAHGWGHRAHAIRTDTRNLAWGHRAWRGAAHCLARGPDGAALAIEAFPAPQVIAAIELTSGRVAWRYPLWVGGYGADSGLAAGSGRFVYVPGWHERLPGQKRLKGGFYCLDAATGKLRWKYERPGMKGIALIVSGTSVFGLGSNGFLYRFLRAGGQAP